MKKIFAIALALVMVLSMASAFAFVGTCGKYEYACATAECGTAKAEVVQFVANNTVDKFEESKCAAVVAGQNIYWGVKVTFENEVNEQWFYHTNTVLEVETSNVSGATTWSQNLTFLTTKTPAQVSGKTFWLRRTGSTTYDLVSTWEPACVFGAVAQNTRANVAATVKFNFNGITPLVYNVPAGDTRTLPGTAWINYGTFEVQVAGANPTIGSDFWIKVKQGGNIMNVFVIGGVVKYVEMDRTGKYYSSFDGTTFKGISGALAAGEATGSETSVTADCTKIDELMALINLKLGNCVDGGTIKAIFGWKNGEGSNATWNKNAVAIANAECQVKVEIPKTGDVSVIAYAVMALVAAAGAMGLKK